jgi:hypothetical protein
MRGKSILAGLLMALMLTLASAASACELSCSLNSQAGSCHQDVQPSRLAAMQHCHGNRQLPSQPSFVAGDHLAATCVQLPCLPVVPKQQSPGPEVVLHPVGLIEAAFHPVTLTPGLHGISSRQPSPFVPLRTALRI